MNASRRVSNMTAEQADRKRAIDRDNQRYHRAKSKAYARALEEKIAEITTRLREAEELIEQHEQREARNHLAAPSPPLYSSPVPSTTVSSNRQTQDSTLAKCDAGPGRLERGPDEETLLSALPLDFGTGTIICPFSSATEIDFLDLDPWSTDESLQLKSDILCMNPPAADESLAVHRYNVSSVSLSSEVSYWNRTPLNLPPMSRLEEVIQTMVETWRERARKLGNQQEEMNEPVFPSIGSLLNGPEVIERDMTTFTNSVAAQIWRSTVRKFTERIGFMYILSHLVRWLICRSKETYEKLPVFLRPTELQCTVPHPAWVDTIVWPEVRDALIEEMDWDRFEEFRHVAGPSISVTWPYPDSTTFIESPDKRTMLLHPGFEAHLRNISNWKLGKEVGELFPFLKRFCQP